MHIAASTPYISVVVCTRNRPKSLADTLLGIFNQSFQEYEVLVIDDGSDTNLIESHYESLWRKLDSRFKLVRLGGDNSPGHGPSKARNFAIFIASGEILSFCDDDDVWTDNSHLARVAEAFSNNPKLDMFIGNQIGVLDGITKIKSWLPKLDLLVSLRDPKPSGHVMVTVEELCHADGFAQLNILSLRTAIAKSIDGFWGGMPYEEDRDFYFRALDRCQEICYCSNIVAQHNIPIPNLQVNQSTRLSIINKLIISSCLCDHIFITCKNRHIHQLAGRYHGDLSRKLALELHSQGSIHSSLAISVRALASRFSLKWLLFTLVMFFRSLAKR